MHTDNIIMAMRYAVQLAEAHNTAFAAVLLNQDGKMIAQDVNSSSDDGPVAHAELNLLLKAGKRWGRLDNHILVSTCEPCPMCASAAFWCRVSTIYFGVSIEQASEFMPQIKINCAELAERSFHKPEIYPGLLQNECLKLFEKKYSKK